MEIEQFSDRQPPSPSNAVPDRPRPSDYCPLGQLGHCRCGARVEWRMILCRADRLTGQKIDHGRD